MKIDFLASGNHFLPFSQTAVNCCQWKQFFINWNIFFSQSFIPASGNEFFVYWKSYCFIPSIFCWRNLLFKIGGSQFLKTKYIPAREHVFSIFLEILRFFKVEATFSYCGNGFFNKFFIQLVKTDFLCSGNNVFWSELFLC